MCADFVPNDVDACKIWPVSLPILLRFKSLFLSSSVSILAVRRSVPVSCSVKWTPLRSGLSALLASPPQLSFFVSILFVVLRVHPISRVSDSISRLQSAGCDVEVLHVHTLSLRRQSGHSAERKADLPKVSGSNPTRLTM